MRLHYRLALTTGVIAVPSALVAAWLLRGPLGGGQGFALAGVAAVGAGLAVAVAWWVTRSMVSVPLGGLAQTGSTLTAGAGDGAPGAAAKGDEVDLVRRSMGHLEHMLQDARGAAAAEQARRRDAERALQDSEERYALAIRAANDGLWEWDIRAGMVTCSPRWRVLAGAPGDDQPIAFEHWLGHIHPDDRAPVQAALDMHVANAAPRFESEHRLLHRDGSVRWVLSRGCAIRHASGQAYRLVGQDTDISGSRRIQDMLQRVTEGTAATTGDEFFRAMVRNFAEVLDVRVAFVTECLDSPATRVRALAFWDADHFVENVEYALEGTPCEGVIVGNCEKLWTRGLGAAFPAERELGLDSYYGLPVTNEEGDVIGHLAFLDAKPMDDSIVVASIHRIFAARAAAEIGRRQVLRRISSLVDALGAARGEECLRLLARDFAGLLGTREAIVTECIAGPELRVRTLAWWRDGEFRDEVSYALADTTCEETIVSGRITMIADGVGTRFPRAARLERESYLGVPCVDGDGHVIGHVACFDSRPMRRHLPDDAVLRLFAERAAVEIERRQLRASLREANRLLQNVRGDAFFMELVRTLSQALGIREVFVCECMDEPATRVRMLARWNHGAYAPCVEFDLAGTTCEAVVDGAAPIYVPHGLGERWPLENRYHRDSYLGIPCLDSEGAVIGHIACADAVPLPQREPDWQVLHILAERAAVELERRRMHRPAGEGHPRAGEA